MRTPDQNCPQEPTTAPVAPLKTGFLSASVETLGEHVQKLYSEAEAASRNMKGFWPDMFGIIDERSARDNTMILARYHRWIPDEMVNSMPPLPHLEGWKTMRLTFEMAISAFYQVSQVPWGFFDEPGKSLYKIEDGVWDVEDMRDFLRIKDDSASQL